MARFISLIFLLSTPNKIIRIKIRINSPLVKINKPVIIEKKNILLNFSSSTNNNKNFKNNNEKTICKFIDDICPQA